MKEYCIYIRQGAGKPYILNTFNNLDNAKLKVLELVELEEERGRPYYIDNDYFNNKYSLVGNLKYICIKQRDITEWTNFSSIEINKREKEKIVYINNFRKS